MTNLHTLCTMKSIFTRTNLNCQNTSFTNFYFPIVSIRLFEEVAMKRWVCPICKTLYFTIAIFKTPVSQLTNTHFTIECPRAGVAMKRRVCPICKTAKTPFHNSPSKLMVLKVLPPVCPATCESNLMAINGAPLSSRYHPLQYNALYAQRKMWPTGCEWCPSWEHQHVIWIWHWSNTFDILQDRVT